MARKSIDNIIHSRNFYRNNFRKVLKLLLISLFMSVCLIIAIYVLIINRGEEGYYATNGITAPVLLNPLDRPNMSSEPLLASYPQDDDTNSNQGSYGKE